MMRIGLFLLTNLAVLVLASITLNILGFDSIMAHNGVDLNLHALLVFCAVFGMSGSIISLFMSKWMARRSTGTRLITEPRTEGERWLVQTVAQLAEQEGIGMPEGVAHVAAEEKLLSYLTLTAESGVIGGQPLSAQDFGTALNATAHLDTNAQFDLYDGGSLDLSVQIGRAHV